MKKTKCNKTRKEGNKKETNVEKTKKEKQKQNHVFEREIVTCIDCYIIYYIHPSRRKRKESMSYLDAILRYVETTDKKAI